MAVVGSCKTQTERRFFAFLFPADIQFSYFQNAFFQTKRNSTLLKYLKTFSSKWSTRKSTKKFAKEIQKTISTDFQERADARFSDKENTKLNHKIKAKISSGLQLKLCNFQMSEIYTRDSNFLQHPPLCAVAVLWAEFGLPTKTNLIK